MQCTRRQGKYFEPSQKVYTEESMHGDNNDLMSPRTKNLSAFKIFIQSHTYSTFIQTQNETVLAVFHSEYVFELGLLINFNK